jgi:ssDNA-binding Zn-finger/Zn-ribbon topoisomerase 1
VGEAGSVSDNKKWQCTECRVISIQSDLLEAKNPFDEEMVISGCPICKTVESFTEICDEPGCTRDASCGFPTLTGYRRTCGDHMRMYDIEVV